MVEVARERVAGLGRYELAAARPADVQDLPFPAAAFDVVVANHLLYHVPEPARAVAELARVVRPGGVVMASTSGARHLRELWALKAEVWGGRLVSETVEVFGIESGAARLARRFAAVEWRDYPDELHCSDAGDVVDFLTSTPPGEDGTPAERAALRRAVEREMAARGGVLRVTEETGVLLAVAPRA
jgi:SAM-dependent methyltransferase